MDDDAATAAGQLFGSGPCGVLVIDARELLSSTARAVGAQLGELHFRAWMALVTLHVAHGLPEDGRATSTLGELARLVWGSGRARSGKDTYALLDVLHDLRDAKFTVPGYDMVNQRPAAGVSDTSLLINLHVDETILNGYAARKQRRELRRGQRVETAAGGAVGQFDGAVLSHSARSWGARVAERWRGACILTTRSAWATWSCDALTGPRRRRCAGSR